MSGLEKHGFAVLRQVLSADVVSRLADEAHNELERAAGAAGWTSKGQPQWLTDEELDPSCLHLPGLAKNEELEQVARSERLQRVMDEVTNGETFIHPNKFLRALPPEASAYYQPAMVHQDYPELQGSAQQCTVWCPLVPVSAESGSLPVYETNGSSTEILPMILDSQSNSGWTVDPELLGRRHVFDLQPGDALMFRTTTPHGGTRNTGNGWRISLEIRFQPVSDPIAENNLRPYAFETWDDVYDGWSEFSFYWRDRHPSSQPFDPSWEHWRDLTAIAEGSRGNPRARRALEIAESFATDPMVRSTAATVLSRMALESRMMA